MDQKQKISVIVPVYNVEKYLENGLEHIINQTYTNLEIILVDDGSKDSSGLICDRYAEKDSRIRVIHKENGGSSSARNRGIIEATGDFIGFLDADDYPEYTMYERLISAFTNENCVIAQCMSRDFDESGNIVKGPYKDSGNITFIPQKENFRLLMMHEGDSSFCTKLIRADFCKRFSFPEHELNEDFKLVLRMLQEIDGVYSVEEPLYNILIRNGSNQRSGFREDYYNAIINNSDYAYSLMKDRFPDAEKETERFRYVQRLDYLLHMPVELMNSENKLYSRIISEIRAEKNIWLTNEFLDQKQRRNLKILSTCPLFAKRVHRIIMKFKNR